MDTKNRRPTPDDVEEETIRRLRRLLPGVSAVIVADQVPERNCGVITDRVREEISVLAQAHPSVVVAADSRERIGLFRDVVAKPNEREAARAIYPGSNACPAGTTLEECGRRLCAQVGRPVFLTMGSQGILVVREDGVSHVPACPVKPPIDIVGAGDATMAGLASALAAGADEIEAAWVGVLASAVTIKQIGTTGTASRAQISACRAGLS
jgi:bifunctional ADP-heptose synthase (sugar kinase/adenylyltransferase)